MLARTTTIQADIDKIDAGIAYVRDEVFPAVSAMSGCIGMSLLADRTSGRCIATTAWESEAAVRDSADKVLSLRAGAIAALGSDTSEVDVWEIAVVHRDHAAPDGACARVTWLSGTPDMAERAVDFYKMGVLPRLQELEGFCSASFMINRETGRAVGTATFETRQQLEASRDTARGLREAAARELGATIDDVAEMELAFAHLHIPEMV
ncbi:antibiotic biosynthesis monooxygenase [Knoellia sp. p5-6-4]|uniref:antibiotic biosynthesis monooxygenase n=1 Tax=unclassified Knoellia TaxID=2618719 RepID=UPI0023DAB7BF|nr:antibiotic biosynthesis monooxygenase [Knoellia sp. p5-6-4]MDF2145980.1 antibiotic biosynthesis monooxygenase [Knoellia sp. p5-6-4]